MSEEVELTEREKIVANEAARLAGGCITDNFYKEVGKAVINRLLVLIGAVVIAFAFGKGWIRF